MQQNQQERMERKKVKTIMGLIRNMLFSVFRRFIVVFVAQGYYDTQIKLVEVYVYSKKFFTADQNFQTSSLTILHNTKRATCVYLPKNITCHMTAESLK